MERPVEWGQAGACAGDRLRWGRWCWAAVLVVGLQGGEVLRGAEGARPAATNAAPRVTFRPPATGAPAVRLTGGSRGTGDNAVVLDVLAPDEVGLTTLEQPSLFWFQSKPSKAKFELTLLRENTIEPLVQVKSESSARAGIQRLRLADHGARLVAGVEYQWVVALITDPENRSSDQVASGVIQRIAVPDGLKQRIAQADAVALPVVYAEAGIWYDALAALSDRLEADPGNAALWESRADLLRQAGLKAAAEYRPGARE